MTIVFSVFSSLIFKFVSENMLEMQNETLQSHVHLFYVLANW